METSIGLHHNQQVSNYKTVAAVAFTGAAAGASVPYVKSTIAGAKADGFISSKAKSIGSLFQKGIDRVKTLFEKISPKKAAVSEKAIADAAEKPGILKKFFTTIKTKINDTGKAFLDKFSQTKKNISDKISDRVKDATARIKNIRKPETSITKIITEFFKKPSVKWAAIGAALGAIGYFTLDKLFQAIGITGKEEKKVYIIK